MNKEAKAIVDYLEEEREAIRTLCYYPDDVLSCEDLIMLMDYINQLETNIDKAIQFSKRIRKEYKYRLNEGHLRQIEKILKDVEQVEE